jgi:hypothetical protein
LCLVVSTTPVVIRNSPIRLPLTRRLNVTSISNLLKHDQARARTLRARAVVGHTSIVSAPIVGNEPVNNQAVTYVAAIGIGTPPTTCQYCGYLMYPDAVLTATVTSRFVDYRHWKVSATAKSLKFLIISGLAGIPGSQAMSGLVPALQLISPWYDVPFSHPWYAHLARPYQLARVPLQVSPITLSYSIFIHFFVGTEYLDTVTITPQLVIHNQSIGSVADVCRGLFL